MAIKQVCTCDKCHALINEGGYAEEFKNTKAKFLTFDVSIHGFVSTAHKVGIFDKSGDLLLCNECFNKIRQVLINLFKFDFKE